VTPTRIRNLLIYTAAFAVASWLVVRFLYGSLPPLPWTMVPALAIAAVAEAWLGYSVRPRILGRPGTKRPESEYVTRLVALAKATSLTAAVIGGVAAGFTVAAASSLPASVPRHDVIVAGTTFGTSVVLALAALYLEHCCRVPDDPGAGRYVPPPPPVDPFH
jgi:Protein of unknown function (DUF3180)